LLAVQFARDRVRQLGIGGGKAGRKEATIGQEICD